MPVSGRTFAYLRVSTSEQTTDNQRHAIAAAGYPLPAHRVVSETVSGSQPAMQRAAFQNLVANRMEEGDTLVVLKLDRLGRDMIDVMATLALLTERGVRVISLDLGNIDLSSPAGKLQVQVMAAVAEFERNRIRERTREGLERAKKEGKALGRPPVDVTPDAVVEARQTLSLAETAKHFGIGVSSVKRLQAQAVQKKQPSSSGQPKAVKAATAKPKRETISADAVRVARQTMTIAQTAKHLGISVASVKRLQANP